MNHLYGRNPVHEALRARRRPIHRIWATTGAAKEPWLASERVEPATGAELEERCGSRDHQGVVAEVGAYPYADLGDLLAALRGRKIAFLGDTRFNMANSWILGAHLFGMKIALAGPKGYEPGATILDASVGGLGGCPFAPRATGNIATEDLVYMLDRMGIATGFDLDRLIDIVPWLEGEVGRPAPGLVARAGPFPGRPR